MEFMLNKCKLKYEYISCLLFKKQLKSWKTNHSSNGFKQRTILSSCSEKKSAFLRGIRSKYVDFYCINGLHLFRTKKTNLNFIKTLWKLRVLWW